MPIDVVYTWVNGSDPKLLAELRREKMLMEQQLNETRFVELRQDFYILDNIFGAQMSFCDAPMKILGN